MANKKRLIDADAEIATIKENVCKNCNSHDGVRCRSCWVDDAIGFLEDAPTVDAVEVVRCSDCKHWDEIEDTCGGGYCNHSCWVALDAEPPVVNHSDFCSYGEKREV